MNRHQTLSALVWIGFGVLAGLALARPAPAAIALQAHYRLDEPAGSGDPVLDSAGGNNGTLINPANVAQGVTSAPYGSGYGLARGGGQSGGVNLGTSAAVRPADDFTVSFWFNADVLDNGFERLVESMDGTAPTSQGYRIDLGGSGTNVRALLRDGTGSSSSKQHSMGLSAGTWYFAALRYDKDANLQVTVIPQAATFTGPSIAGATETSGTPTGDLVYQAGRPTVLGVEDSSGAANNSFQGVMDDVAFWDSVLADDQLGYVGTYGAAAPVPLLHWHAADPPVNDGTRDEWFPRVGSGYDWDFANANGPDQVPSGSSYRPLTHAYRYDGDEDVPFTDTSDSTVAFNEFNQTASASFEIWVRPAALDNGKQVLWETGGVNGSSLTLEDDLVRFGTASSSGSPNEVETFATLGPGAVDEFVQLVGVFDKGNNQTRLYLNGTLMDLVGDTTGNFSGGNAAGLGTQQGAAVGGYADENVGDLFGTFFGDIAVFNFYDYALTDTQVRSSFLSVAVPEPGTLWLAVLGLLGGFALVRRRRRR